MRRIILALLVALIFGAPSYAQNSGSFPGGGSLTIGTTPITSGTNGNCLYINGTALGQQSCFSGASAITVNTSVITGGTTTRFLYDNAGTIGETAGITFSGGNINIATASVAGAGGTSLTLLNSGNNQTQLLIGSAGLLISQASQNFSFSIPVAGTLQFGQNDAVSPVAQTLQFQNGATLNTAGVNSTISGSLSSGSGTSGDIIIQTGVKSGVSGTLATKTTALTIKGETQHNSYGGGAPSIVAGAACGGGSPTIDSSATDSSGSVVVGTATTTCVITFAKAYATFNHCIVTSGSTLAAFAYVYTLSAITVSATVLGGDKLDYRCDGI